MIGWWFSIEVELHNKALLHSETYLDHNIPHFSVWADDRTSYKCWEDVVWEIGPSEATLDKLQNHENNKGTHYICQTSLS